MRKSKKKLLAMLLAGTMVFGMLPSNAFANNEQDPTSTVVDEPVTTDDSTKLEEEGDTNQGTTEVEAPVEEANPQEAETENKTEEALPEGDANTEVAVDLSLEEIKIQKTEEIKAGEKYIIVYDNKKALSTGKDNIIAVPVEIEGDTVKTEITKNIIWTVDDKGNLTTEEDKYLTSDLELQEKVEEGQSFKLDKKNVSYEENEVNTYLTYNEEKNEWRFEEKENEAVTYYNVVGPVETLEELTEEELDKIEQENKPEEPTETPAEGENSNETPEEPQDTAETPVEGTTLEGDDEVGAPEDGVEDEVAVDGEQEEAVVDDSTTFAVGDKYKLHTGDIVAGEYIIVAGSDNYALTNNNNNNNNSVGKTQVAINNSEITANNSNYIWNFDGSTMKNGDYYLRYGSGFKFKWGLNISKTNIYNETSVENKNNGKYQIEYNTLFNGKKYLNYSSNNFNLSDSESSTVRLYKKIEKVTLTANFYDYNNQSTSIATTQTFNNLIGGNNSPTVVLDNEALKNYEFVEMKVNDQKLNVTNPQLVFNNITENTTVNYYYKIKSGGGDSGTADDIILNKTATNERLTSDDRGYMYDINLNVQGKEITSNNPVDVTLVLDVSGSMSGNNLKNTKTAANTFIENTMPNGNSNIRISLVKYSNKLNVSDSNSTPAAIYNFNTSRWVSYNSVNSSSKGNDYYTYTGSTAKTVINNLSADGGTNTEAGLIAAKNVTAIRNRADAQSIVLFMTDGLPTYSGSTTSGDGDKTSVTEFNAAVTAGVNLKNAGNTVYTIGLLAGMKTNEIFIADRLLSSNFKYTATGNSSELNNKTVTDLEKIFTYSTPAYSSGYYKVTNPETAASEMEKIYKDLASKVLSLATGSVTDIIPAEFKLTEESKQDLIDSGHNVTVNNDGTTTIIFNNITAGKEITNLPTFTIEPNTEFYGAKFTNVQATYDYTLFDKSTGTKYFDVPQGFITPLTNPDMYHTTVNTNYIISNVLENDPSFNKKLQDNGYTVSDLTYRLVNADGSDFTGINDATVSLKDGAVTFTSPKEGTYEFYYVAEGIASKDGVEDKTLISKVTKVTVHVYDIENKVFVIDYGKPVIYSADTVFNKNIEKATNTVITLPESENSNSKCGTLVLNNDKSITYTLNRYMDQIDKFNFNVKIENINQPLNKTVTIMPATTVYYEDNFGNTSDEDGTNGIVFTGNWKIEGTYVDDNQDSTQGGNYGFDSSYADDLQLSGGSSHVITVGEGQEASASFTFKGTGFDLISRTKNDTGSIIVEISKVNEDKTLTKVKKTIINNQYQSGDLYQIPVVNFYTEEYATYQVDITVGETVFYLDAIRIYNPLGFNEEAFEEAYDRYADDGEANANIREVRNLLIASGDFNADKSISNGAVFIDAEGETPGQKTSSISDYKNLGPNNEVYLSNGQSVAFKIEGYENAASIQIGLKTPNSNTVDNNVVINKNVDATKQQLVTVKTATDMYYDITDIVKADKGLITINNLSTDILAITNIKITSGTKTTTFNIVSDQETVVIANMLAYEASNNKSADIDGSGVVDIYDLANVASNQDKEVIIGVSTDIYRQDLTGTRTIDREDLNIVKDNIQ